jgi:hypothetical protein
MTIGRARALIEQSFSPTQPTAGAAENGACGASGNFDWTCVRAGAGVAGGRALAASS